MSTVTRGEARRITQTELDALAAELGQGLKDTRAVAAFLGMSPRSLEDKRQRGGGPPYISISGRAVRYRPKVVARWLLEREVASTSEAGAGA